MGIFSTSVEYSETENLICATCRRSSDVIFYIKEISNNLIFAGFLCPRCGTFIQRLVSVNNEKLRKEQINNLRDIWLKKAATK